MPRQMNEFGGAVPEDTYDTTEDERSAALARRARLGDYDEGTGRKSMPPVLHCPDIKQI